MKIRGGGWVYFDFHRVLVGNYYLPLISIKGGAAGYRQVKVLEFFDCPGLRQGVEDLRELLHKESMEYMMKNVFGLRWNCRELKGIVKLRFFSKPEIWATKRCLLRAVNVTRLSFRDSSASFAVVCFFRGRLLLRDASLYLLDIESVLTQKGLDTFCRKFHIPESVHPQLPSHNQTMHERPARKIGVYTRFFEYANFWLPLSTFLVDVLRDPLPKSTEFNVDDYVVVVAHPAPLRKFPEPFLCLVGMSPYYTLDEDTYPRFLHDDGKEMDLFAFIHVVDPTKVKIVDRERAEGERKLLDSTVRRVVSLLPDAPAHSESDLKASVDKLFDEGCNTDQGVLLSVVVITLRLNRSWMLKILILPNLRTIGPLKGSLSLLILPITLVQMLLELKLILLSEFNSRITRQACLNAEILLKEAEATKPVHIRIQVSAAEAAEKVYAGEMNALKQKNVALEKEKDSLDGKVELAGERGGVLAGKVGKGYCLFQSLVVDKERELKDLNVTVSSLKSQNDDRMDQVHALEATCSGLCDQVSNYELLKEQIEAFQDAQMKILSDNVASLDVNLLEMALHLEEKFYPHLLTIIYGRRWLLTRGLKLAVVKCLNSQGYLAAFGAVINRAIKKGMQIRLLDGIDHGKACRSLADVVAYNPATEADYNSALIRENVASQRSALVDVWVPLVEPLSAKNLMGASVTSDSVPATVATMTALSTTFASISFIPSITIDDYEIVSADGQEDVQGNVQRNVASFLMVGKEELDTTP
uniref:Transposase (Putative), gypsy type n=1 Tax=Tanacetum cinerariifolium TaxID=118510 RepID=A0A6L2MBV0_TANCI|nr:transposase (putative), gypsy type [Tanacetum cinerariifolium]